MTAHVAVSNVFVDDMLFAAQDFHCAAGQVLGVAALRATQLMSVVASDCALDGSHDVFSGNLRQQSSATAFGGLAVSELLDWLGAVGVIKCDQFSGGGGGDVHG